MAAKDEKKFDVRLIENRIRSGNVTPDEYKQYLASLPDEAAEGEESKASFVATSAQRRQR
jgi:hypothetical protein